MGLIAANVFVVSIAVSISAVLNGVSVVCKVFFAGIQVKTGDFIKAAVKDDELLLLVVVWLAVELLVVVLGKLDTGQFVETGSIEFIKI